ncbi:hypothetical protein CEK28_14605 [Xenophilus sp. AP218F]|nr:hypothetical protein CEK28_14605 [Xenophilus sp. AP218F]
MVGCALILIERDGCYLWQRRAWDDADSPGCLDFAAGGGIEEGESALAAAQRELWEELGVCAAALRALGAYRLANEPCHVFLADWPAQMELGAEVAETVALTLDELRRLPGAALHPQLCAWLALQPQNAHNLVE